MMNKAQFGPTWFIYFLEYLIVNIVCEVSPFIMQNPITDDCGISWLNFSIFIADQHMYRLEDY